MSARSRGFIKLSAMLLPALLLILFIKFAGPAIGSGVRQIFKRGDLVFDDGGIFAFKVPNEQWHLQLEKWTKAFVKDLVDFDAQSTPRFGLNELSNRKITIHLVEDDAFQELKIPKHRFGAFNPATNHITIVRQEALKDVLEAVSRELSMALLHFSAAGSPDWSHWLAEGMALYFESDRTVFGGKRTDRMTEAARRKEGSLDAILAARPEHFGANGSSAFASETYSLIYFLLHSPKYAERFEAYLAEERKPLALPARRFREILGPEVEKDWLEYR